MTQLAGSFLIPLRYRKIKHSTRASSQIEADHRRNAGHERRPDAPLCFWLHPARGPVSQRNTNEARKAHEKQLSVLTGLELLRGPRLQGDSAAVFSCALSLLLEKSDVGHPALF